MSDIVERLCSEAFGLDPKAASYKSMRAALLWLAGQFERNEELQKVTPDFSDGNGSDWWICNEIAAAIRKAAE